MITVVNVHENWTAVRREKIEKKGLKYLMMHTTSLWMDFFSLLLWICCHCFGTNIFTLFILSLSCQPIRFNPIAHTFHLIYHSWFIIQVYFANLQSEIYLIEVETEFISKYRWWTTFCERKKNHSFDTCSVCEQRWNVNKNALGRD